VTTLSDMSVTNISQNVSRHLSIILAVNMIPT